MEVEEKVKEIVEWAKQNYPLNGQLDNIQIVYDLHGRVAGKACYGSNKIRVNPIALKLNYNDMLEKTIPHEVAHLIAYHIYNCKDHSYDWKKVMVKMGLSPKRCHDYNLPYAKGGQRYLATCNCSEHYITKGMAEKIGKYKCKDCGSRLKLVRPLTEGEMIIKSMEGRK